MTTFLNSVLMHRQAIGKRSPLVTPLGGKAFWARQKPRGRSATYDLSIVNGLAARRALLRCTCLGQYFKKKAARATSKKFRRVTSVNV